VYKVDRLSRSLLDFARMMELFDRHGVSFVSVTQQFNTTSSLVVCFKQSVVYSACPGPA
jgi:site-specific DNA recombinase